MIEDVVSSMLDALRVRTSLLCRAELEGDWAVHTSGAVGALFHAVVRGHAYVRSDGSAPVALAAGDVVVLAQGQAHTMAAGPDLEPVPIRTLPTELDEHGTERLVIAGCGARTELLCGRVTFERREGWPLFETLPPRWVVRAEDPHVDGWTMAVIRRIDQELRSSRAGARAAVDRLMDVLVVDAMRAVLEGATWSSSTGWVGALQDQRIARALAAIHGRPDAEWTAQSLAKHAGMSRSHFHARFLELIGEAPARYLSRWRLNLGAVMLRERNASVAEAAAAAGFRSVPSFSKAFRGVYGSSPGAYRDAG